MVSRSTAVDGGRGGGAQRDCRERRHAARHKPRRISALQPELATCRVPQGRRERRWACQRRKHLHKGPRASAAPAAGGCTSRYSVFFASACFSPKARGRTSGRLPWAFDEHLEDPSYSFRGLFSARASGKTLASSKPVIYRAGARVRRSTDAASSVNAVVIRRVLQPGRKSALRGGARLKPQPTLERRERAAFAARTPAQ